MEKKLAKKEIILLLSCFAGVFLRFWVMSYGHNFDFQSYCIVGELASKLENVYAATHRYNYGPIFFCILGTLFKISQYVSSDNFLTYRILVVGLLTLVDLGIMFWISCRYSIKAGIIFFLNPISIIISGYHNQFDNIAIFFALISCCYYNEDKEINKKDLKFLFFITISLITKHIFYILPFWLLVKKGLPFKKRILYAFVPPMIFLLSFVPFIINNDDAFHGILNNVFLYRSVNNSPLLSGFYSVINLPNQYWFIIFVVMMILLAFVIRNQPYEYQILFYMLVMVAFSSALANQYLVIPVVALCILSKGIYRYSYFIAMSTFLLINGNGLHILNWLTNIIPESKLINIMSWYDKKGYCLAAYILFISVISEVIKIYHVKRKGFK